MAEEKQTKQLALNDTKNKNVTDMYYTENRHVYKEGSHKLFCVDVVCQRGGSIIGGFYIVVPTGMSRFLQRSPLLRHHAPHE